MCNLNLKICQISFIVGELEMEMLSPRGIPRMGGWGTVPRPHACWPSGQW